MVGHNPNRPNDNPPSNNAQPAGRCAAWRNPRSVPAAPNNWLTLAIHGTLFWVDSPGIRWRGRICRSVLPNVLKTPDEVLAFPPSSDHAAQISSAWHENRAIADVMVPSRPNKIVRGQRDIRSSAIDESPVRKRATIIRRPGGLQRNLERPPSASSNPSAEKIIMPSWRSWTGKARVLGFKARPTARIPSPPGRGKTKDSLALVDPGAYTLSEANNPSVTLALFFVRIDARDRSWFAQMQASAQSIWPAGGG